MKWQWLLRCLLDRTLRQLRRSFLPGIGALLAVPLEVFKCVRGVIYVDTCDPAVRFDLGHLRLLAAVGGLAALALENARRL